MNGQEQTQNLTFTSAMNRIPATIFYIYSLSGNITNILNIKERNLYELMLNLLNGYYINVKKLSLILAQDAVDSSKNSIPGKVAFYSSFVFAIIFLVLIWYLLSYLILERQKPINLFLTIKKQIFEDLKNASETFSNKLLNKLIGNEDNEEESQKDYKTNIKEKDINIIKFKSPNNYKMKGKDNKKLLIDYFKLVFFLILIQVYIIFKFFYSRNYIDSTKKFLDIFNITCYTYPDILKD
jgi:ABC-type multidrug transport system fused ATPase/permease subunit